jgi:hypothetical protein
VNPVDPEPDPDPDPHSWVRLYIGQWQMEGVCVVVALLPPPPPPVPGMKDLSPTPRVIFFVLSGKARLFVA